MSTPTTPIRTALIGFGLSGQTFHAPFLRTHPEFELVAVGSRQTDTVHQLAPEARVCSHTHALTAPDVDLVVITAPNEEHYPLARAALQADKHVVLEKPAVTQPAQMEDLLALARTRSRLITVYQNRRYDGDFLRLKALVDSNKLGAIKTLTSRFDRFRPQPQDRWRERPGVGAGIFWDLAPHLADQALQLLGLPEQVQASMRALRTGSTTTDWFEALLKYPDCQVTLSSSPFVAGPFTRFQAGFTQGTWQVQGLDEQEGLLRQGHQPATDQWANALAVGQAAFWASADQQQEETVLPGDYHAFYSQLARALRGHGDAPVTALQARQLVVLLATLETAAETGQTLHPTLR